MTPSAGTEGVVLECKLGGEVRSVLRDDIGLGVGQASGRPFPTLVDPGSVRKALEFLMAARRAPVPEWELAVETRRGARVCWFAAAAQGADLWVLGASTRSALAQLCDELRERSDGLGRAACAICGAVESLECDEGGSFDELARLYNDFASLQRELARKNVELEQMVRERDLLVSTAAHDLRSPLGAICNLAAILREDTRDRLTDWELQALARIEHSSQFMQKLVEAMLELSQSSWGELKLAREEVDFAKLLALIVAVNRPLATRKGIDLSLEVKGVLPRIAIDANKIEQVLNNLIANAVKYSYGGTRVQVAVQAEDSVCLVRVQDEGQGIPEEELPKLFHPFSRTCVRPTDGEATTGLGLAIAKRIVDAHEGRLWVESVVGRGSVFHFALPIGGVKARGRDTDPTSAWGSPAPPSSRAG